MAFSYSKAKGTLILFAGVILGFLLLGAERPATAAFVPCDLHAAASPMDSAHGMAGMAHCPMGPGEDACCCTMAVNPMPPTLALDNGMPVFGTTNAFGLGEAQKLSGYSPSLRPKPPRTFSL